MEPDKRSVCDRKTVFDGLIKAFKFAERLTNDRLNCENDKQIILDEIRRRIEESVVKQRVLQEGLTGLKSEIDEADSRIQHHKYKCEKSLTVLVNLTESLNRSKPNAQLLKLVEQMQTFFLRSFTKVMLELRDYTVRSFRNHGSPISLNESELEQVLSEIKKIVGTYHQDILALVGQIDNRAKESKIRILEPYPASEETASNFLAAMESSAFNFNQFNF